jgi:hypothetical protein
MSRSTKKMIVASSIKMMLLSSNDGPARGGEERGPSPKGAQSVINEESADRRQAWGVAKGRQVAGDSLRSCRLCREKTSHEQSISLGRSLPLPGLPFTPCSGLKCLIVNGKRGVGLQADHRSGKRDAHRVGARRARDNSQRSARLRLQCPSSLLMGIGLGLGDPPRTTNLPSVGCVLPGGGPPSVSGRPSCRHQESFQNWPPLRQKQLTGDSIALGSRS